MPDVAELGYGLDTIAQLHILAEADRLSLISHDWYVTYLAKCLRTLEKEIGVDIPKGDH